jgi:hypothetical protein
MGTANRDASQVTKRNRNKAENSYYQGWKAATVNGSGNSALTAPGASGAESLLEARDGCYVCTVYNNSSSANPDPNMLSLNPPNRSAGGAGGLTGNS